MLIMNRYRVIFTAYVNNETLNDFYSTLLITKQNDNLRIANALSLTQRTSFNIYLIIETSLTLIKNNSFE